jgi:hypothetical protein
VDIVGLVLTALILGCIGLAALFGYLLVTSRTATHRSAARWEQSSHDRIE